MISSIWLVTGILCAVPSVFTESVRKPPPPNYAKFPDNTRKLAMLEVALAEKLRPVYLELSHSQRKDYRHCHKSLFKYLIEYETDLKAINAAPRNIKRTQTVVENPLLTMRLIRRIVRTLLNETIVNCRKTHAHIAGFVDLVFQSGQMVKPTEIDLREALNGILNLQSIYRLNATSQLRLGNLNGIETKVHLNFDDCMALAQAALQKDLLVLAYQWLLSAQLIALNVHNHITTEEILNMDHYWDKLRTVSYQDTMSDLHREMLGRNQEEFIEQVVGTDTHALCRGETIDPEETPIDLDCYYDKTSNSYFFINPMKKEVISEDPRILQFYDFATDTEINRIDLIGAINLDLYGPNDEILKRLKRKIEMVTRLAVNNQVPGYFERGLYTPLGLFSQMEKFCKKHVSYDYEAEKNRSSTFLINMNDVAIGGNFIFPKLKKFSQPVKGSALFWFNLDFWGKHDERVIHKSCPVVLGTKQTAIRPLEIPTKVLPKCYAVYA